MELKQIEAFAAVAEFKSFSKAANHLFLTQPTVSTHVRALEKELGVTLFERTTKSLSLTDDGKKFMRYAKRMVDLKHAAIDTMCKTEGRPLHIGASSIPSAYLLPEILSGFCENNKNVSFSIYQGDSREIEEKVIDATLELGIIGAKSESDLCICKPVFNDRLAIVTPTSPEYTNLREQNSPLKELCRFPFITRESGSGTQSAAEALLKRHSISISDLHTVIRTNDLESIKQMIVKGIGFSIMSDLAVKDLKKLGKVIVYYLDDRQLKRFHMIYLRQQNRPEILRLIKYLDNFRNV